jgi:chromosome segregation ATPase
MFGRSSDSLRSLEEKIEVLQVEKEEFKHEVNRLSLQLAGILELASTEEGREDFSHLVVRLLEENQMLKREHELKNKSAEFQNIDRLELEKRELKSESESLHAALEHANKEIQRLKQLLNKQTETCSLKDTEIQTLCESLLQSNKSLQISDLKILHLSEQLVSYESEISSLKSLLQSTQLASETSLSELNRTHRLEMQNLEHKISQLVQDHDHNSLEQSRLHRQLSSTKKEFQRISTQLEEYRNRTESLEQDLFRKSRSLEDALYALDLLTPHPPGSLIVTPSISSETTT